MIRRLRLENFRRHADTEIHFNDEEHLILISGENGVGKSTILEGLLFGLYGEGREGRRNLDRLVRRGYELEGMTVEVVFEVGGTEYRVVRRRVGRSATAVLYGNEEPLVESVQAVTDEVARILGMDVHAFKLAVMAQQKELDGLAAHTPSIRRRMISRLLRVDLVVRARDTARSAYRTLTDVVKALGGNTDAEKLAEHLQAAEERVAAQQKVLREAEERVSELTERVAAYVDDEAAWAASEKELVRAETAVVGLRRRVGRLQSDLERIQRKARTIDAGGAGLDELRSALLVVERRLAEIGEAEAHAAQMQAIQKEAQTDRRRLAEVLNRLEEIGEPAELGPLQKQLVDAQSMLQAATTAHEAAVRERATVEERLRSCEERLAKTKELGDVCVECGQPVTVEHRQEVAERLQRELEEARTAVQAADARRREALVEQARAGTAVEEATAALQKAEESHREVNRLEEEAAGLRRRISVYHPSEVSLPDQDEKKGLEEWRDAIEAQVAARERLEAELAEEAQRVREEARIQAELKTAEFELEAARAAVVDAQPSDELKERIEEAKKVRTELDAEREMTASLRVEVAVAEGDLKLVQAAVKAEEERAAERRAKMEEATLTSGAADALGDLADQLVREIRPTLGTAVGEILAQLSNNRFTKVEIGEEYEIWVEDEGALRDLAELSGGERDLVALAFRLGLSALVAERHGSGGPGFLILDECFGSQDEGRRETIMEALRSLRSAYKQILLISHVGGLEDACDRVLEVKLTDGGTVAEVRDI